MGSSWIVVATAFVVVCINAHWTEAAPISESSPELTKLWRLSDTLKGAFDKYKTSAGTSARHLITLAKDWKETKPFIKYARIAIAAHKFTKKMAPHVDRMAELARSLSPNKEPVVPLPVSTRMGPDTPKTLYEMRKELLLELLEFRRSMYNVRRILTGSLKKQLVGLYKVGLESKKGNLTLRSIIKRAKVLLRLLRKEPKKGRWAKLNELAEAALKAAILKSDCDKEE